MGRTIFYVIREIRLIPAQYLILKYIKLRKVSILDTRFETINLYILLQSIVKNKSIILIDDSLVRGTTCNKIVKMLYESGAKEVHVRIACPPIKHPDFYGVDMPTKEELLAHKKNNQEMCDHIQAKSLKFLSLEGLYNALLGENRNSNYPQFSDHYFTGEYPIKPQDDFANIRLKQLSLLSGKSNS